MPVRAIALLSAASAVVVALVLRAVGAVHLAPAVTTAAAIAVEILAAAAIALRAATMQGRSPARTAWWLISGGLVTWAIGDLMYSLLWGTGDGPVPNVSDPVFFCFYGFFGAGMCKLISARSAGRGTGLAGDGLVAGLGVATLAAALLAEPVAASLGGGLLPSVVMLGYPVADVALLVTLCVGCSVLAWRPGAPLVLCGLAVVALAVGDLGWALDVSIDGMGLDHWAEVMYSLSSLLMAIGAWRPLAGLQARPKVAIPLFAGFAFAVFASTLLFADRWIHVPAIATVLAAVTVGVGLVRTARLIMHSSRRVERFRAEAITDGLTGLANRRALARDLERAVADGERPATLALFDLNGFKDYNDTFGHGAGDGLLCRIAANLRDATGTDGSAYRLGGDEFCVLFDGRRDEYDPAVRRVTEAFRVVGEGFAIDASCGVVRIPDEAATPADALRVADGRMYAHKESARPSSARSARDVLTLALGERHPQLGEHIRGVAERSTAVGRRLGLSAVALEVLERAAELHDIGKLAMPDRLLGKPDGLDADEWTLMRRHPEIGARILSPVTALAPVAELVAASHERWDGSGYPAGAAGAAIPLGARIIAVCDVYDAMVTERPYASTRSPEQALREIRAGAGTLFDPAVVEAFAAELAVTPHTS